MVYKTYLFGGVSSRSSTSSSSALDGGNIFFFSVFRVPEIHFHKCLSEGSAAEEITCSDLFSSLRLILSTATDLAFIRLRFVVIIMFPLSSPSSKLIQLTKQNVINCLKMHRPTFCSPPFPSCSVCWQFLRCYSRPIAHRVLKKRVCVCNK